jgi:hypothetical protein
MTEQNQDKRSVFTDALETLGTIIDDTQKRDAIHLAVEPVVAKETVWPGQHVTVEGLGAHNGKKGTIGIVDPFLTEMVRPGQRFWLVLYPRTIKSLRHVWEHPDFPTSELQASSESTKSLSDVEKSKKWIENYVKECQEHEHKIDYDYVKKEPLNYDNLMRFADRWIEMDDNWREYFYVSDSLEGLPDEFWDHYQIVTGKKVEENKKVNFFTCSC